MATKEDCVCEVDASDKLLYNPRCRFHKGPDRGYGYDTWGQPNSKYSELAGTIVAGVIAGSVALGILFLILKALLEW